MVAKWTVTNSDSDAVGERIAPLNAARTAQRAVPTATSGPQDGVIPKRVQALHEQDLKAGLGKGAWTSDINGVRQPLSNEVRSNGRRTFCPALECAASPAAARDARQSDRDGRATVKSGAKARAVQTLRESRVLAFTPRDEDSANLLTETADQYQEPVYCD